MLNEDLLRRELTARIERLIGTKVESYSRVEGGYTPALRRLCKTTQASFSVTKSLRRKKLIPPVIFLASIPCV
jgi:hypothetical protein